MDNSIKEFDNFGQETMLSFLKKHCPIVRQKLNKKDRQFTRMVVIDKVFLRKNTDTIYSLNKSNQLISLMEDLYKVLTNVFFFPHKEIVIVLSIYLEIDS